MPTVKYATFSGRARRSEYWWFSVVYMIAAVALVEIGWVFEVPLLGVLLQPFLVPMLSVSVRRLHDTGRSGWRMLIGLGPVAGPIVYLVGMMADSAPGANRYGPSPETAGHLVGKWAGVAAEFCRTHVVRRPGFGGRGTGARLRAVGKVCRTLTLTVRHPDRSSVTRTLEESTAHSAALTGTAYGLYEALGLQRARVRAIALRAGPRPRGQCDRPVHAGPRSRRAGLLPARLRPRRREDPPYRGGDRRGAGEVRPGRGEAGDVGGVTVSWPTGE